MFRLCEHLTASLCLIQKLKMKFYFYSTIKYNREEEHSVVITKWSIISKGYEQGDLKVCICAHLPARNYISYLFIQIGPDWSIFQCLSWVTAWDCEYVKQNKHIDMLSDFQLEGFFCLVFHFVFCFFFPIKCSLGRLEDNHKTLSYVLVCVWVFVAWALV